MLRRCGVVTRIVLGSRLNRMSNDYIRKSLGVPNITEKIGGINLDGLDKRRNNGDIVKELGVK